MQKQLISLSAATALLLGTVSVHADTLVRPRVGMSSTSYEIGGNYLTGTSDYTATNIGVTFAFDSGTYFDVAYTTSGDATHDSWVVDDDFKRTDLALTYGFSFTDTGTMFLGYKTGTSELSTPPQANKTWTEDTFETSGFFYGLSFGFPVTERSALSLNGALALMTANWSDDVSWDMDADYALGYSFGAAYTHAFTQNFGMVADWKYHYYEFEFDLGSYQADETVNAFGLSLYANF